MSTIEKKDEAIDLARYKQAAEEIETGNRDDALWYKAFAEGGGDENATKATYIRLRVDQLRRAAVAISEVRVTSTTSDPVYEAMAYGLSKEEIEYLGKPIEAIRYLTKYGVSKEQVSKAISLGKIRSVICRDVLWVQDIQLDPAKRTAYTPATPTAKPKPKGAKSLYDVLGIIQDASDEEILAGYQKQIAILYAHDNQDAETKNKLIFIQHAKEVLLDPVKRAAYDARITAEAAQPVKIGREKTSDNSKASASEPLSEHDLYAAYLGEKNQDYYLEKFEQFDRLGDGMHMSWNWPASITFLLGATWWALYRKLYAWFFVLLFLGAILLAMTNSRIDAIAAFAFVFLVASATAVGMFSNVIYYRRVKAKIADAKSVTRSDDELIELLRKKGGIHSWVWWILWVLLAVFIIGILAAIAIPAYSDYTKKAKAVGARPTIEQPVVEQPAANPPANDQLSKMEQPSVEQAKSMLVGQWVCKYEQGEYVGKKYYPKYHDNGNYGDGYGDESKWDIMPDGALLTDLLAFKNVTQLSWVSPTEFITIDTDDAEGKQLSPNKYSVARCNK